MKRVDEWVKSCLHKTRLSEGHADEIIARVAKEENLTLYKYYCPHCFGWHLTRKKPK
jgi:hypothetical protein